MLDNQVAPLLMVQSVVYNPRKKISQLSSEHEIHPNLIRAWKRQLQEDGPRVFATNGERKQKEQEAQEAELYEQIGRLKMELEWLKKKVTRFGQ